MNQSGLDSVRKLDPREIFEIEGERSGGDWKAAYASVAKAIQDGSARVMRYGNTLFVYELLGQGQAEVHMATADDAKGILKAIIEFVKAMKIAGFQKLITEIENPQMFRLFDLAKVNYEVFQAPEQSDAQNMVEIYL
jgi:hypothetical protein